MLGLISDTISGSSVHIRKRAQYLLCKRIRPDIRSYQVRIRFDIRISLIDKLLAIEAGWLEGNEQDGYIYLRLRSTGTVNGATKGMVGNGWEWE